MITKEDLKNLREYHTATLIPPCRVCGGELTPQHFGGGGPTTWGCSGYEANPDKPKEVRMSADRSLADKHYADSIFMDYKHDDKRILELLDVYESTKVKIKRAYPVEFDVLFVPICQVCGAANHNHSPAKMKKCLNEYAEGDE